MRLPHVVLPEEPEEMLAVHRYTGRDGALRWESWSLGVKERNGAVYGRRSDASRIRRGETGRLAAPWGRGRRKKGRGHTSVDGHVNSIDVARPPRPCPLERGIAPEFARTAAHKCSKNMVQYHCFPADGEVSDLKSMQKIDEGINAPHKVDYR